MNERLKVLYDCLLTNNKHIGWVAGWHERYVAFLHDIVVLRLRLEKSSESIDNQSLYQDLNSLSSQNYDDFVKKLLYEHSNGVSSRGQSMININDLNKLKGLPKFKELLKNIILRPTKENYVDFCILWKDQVTKYNPVLINRLFAACAPEELSTTVDEGKFNQVFHWLQKEGFIEVYTAQEEDNWLTRNQHLMSELYKVIKDEDCSRWVNIFVWLLYTNLNHKFALKKQTVRYGAPGTGKTYISKLEAKQSFDYWKACYAPQDNQFNFEQQFETVQFHPSFTYEDFIEGLRPVPSKKGDGVDLKLQNGVFKSFCLKAGKWEIDLQGVIGNKDLSKISLRDLDEFKSHLKDCGAHWNYLFELQDRKQKLLEALPPHFFLIDEINRAELSRVFGELMYCLEYRGVAGAVKSQYANLNTEETSLLALSQSNSDYRFFIPNNVFIMATMNTIDRSVESFDFALRRRFHWIKVVPDYDLLKYSLPSKWQELVDSLKKLNDLIAKDELLGDDYCVGHSYLMNLPFDEKITPVKDVRNIIWENEILPLLEEYLRGTGDISSKLETFAEAFWSK